MESGKKDTGLGWLTAGGMALAAGWAFYAQALAPLRQREAETLRSIAALEERIAAARGTLAEVRALEAQVSGARNELRSLQSNLPAGSAMVWLPELITGHFGRFGVAVAIVRLNTTVAEPELSGYNRGYWSVALPLGEAGRNVPGLLLAVAELEQQQPFVQVLDFAIRPDPEDPDRRIAGLNVAVLFRE